MTSKRGAVPSQRASAGAPSIGGKSILGASLLSAVTAATGHFRDQAVTRRHDVGFLARQDLAALQRDAADAAVGAAGAAARRVVAPLEGGAGNAEGLLLEVLDLQRY